MSLSKLKSLFFCATLASFLGACSGGWTPTKIGGSVSGLNSGTTLVLTNLAGLAYQANEVINVTANGSFTFSNTFSPGAAYNVVVSTQPSGQFCVVNNGNGVIDKNADPISNISVTCSAAATISGTLQGLTSGSSINLQNLGGDTLTLTANGSFTFVTAVPSGASYNVAISAQPSGELCTVANPTGGIGATPINVTNVTVKCQPSALVEATVSGLLANTAVVLSNNGSLSSVPVNGTVVFGNTLTAGTQWAVSVYSQPTGGQFCKVQDPSTGTIDANLTTVNVNVNCVAAAVISGTVNGLNATNGAGLVLADNVTDKISVGANGNFTFPIAIPAGGSYNVSIATQPTNSPSATGGQQKCTVAAGTGTGTIPATPANITNIVVNCL